jgi:diadenosine tetraphosphate (Ap4A) HIT family hydrolase
MNEDCPFCNPPDSNEWHSNDQGIVLWDGFPVAEGHSLIVPKTHVASLFDLAPEDQQSLWKMVAEVRELLTKKLNPDGFNIGLNDGVAAEQTVMHCHIHVVPRWNGDVADPRGGVRWVLPEKACYWGGK